MTILRIKLLLVSATKTAELLHATPIGKEKSAALPIPLTRPRAIPSTLPPPARVLTVREATSTTRTRLLLVSPTNTSPEAAASPHGQLNDAALPTPLA
jgi:hypothetical protein